MITEFQEGKYYVLSGGDGQELSHYEGPYESVAEGVEDMGKMLMGPIAPPEFLRVPFVKYSAGVVDLVKYNGQPVNGTLLRGLSPEQIAEIV